jgi:hypothetical protein
LQHHRCLQLVMQAQFLSGFLEPRNEADFQLVVDYLMELASAGDARALRCAALVCVSKVCIGEFAQSLTKVPELVELCQLVHSDRGNKTLKFKDLRCE